MEVQSKSTLFVPRVMCGSDLQTELSQQKGQKLKNIVATILSALENHLASMSEKMKNKCKAVHEYYLKELPDIIKILTKKSAGEKIICQRDYAFDYDELTGLFFYKSNIKSASYRI